MKRYIVTVELQAESVDHALITLAAHFARVVAETNTDSGALGLVDEALIRTLNDEPGRAV